MFAKTITFSSLIEQQRWKVEFFISEKRASRSAIYPIVPLGELLIERRESLDPQKYPTHLFNYLSLEHVEPLTGDLIDEYCPREGLAVLSKSKVFRRGDLLYGRLRPALNKVFVADEVVSEGICSGEFYVLMPETSKILPHFARALLASRYVQDVVRGMTTGSALPRLQLADLMDIEIPVPPVAIQCDFEKMLVEQRFRRRQLYVEYKDGPKADLEQLVSALEGGKKARSKRPIHRQLTSYVDLKLPIQAVTSSRRRGRAAADAQLLMNLA